MAENTDFLNCTNYKHNSDDIVSSSTSYSELDEHDFLLIDNEFESCDLTTLISALFECLGKDGVGRNVLKPYSGYTSQAASKMVPFDIFGGYTQLVSEYLGKDVSEKKTIKDDLELD
nr:hypothetical protein Y105C5B.x - Caenorhabditis elegans [Caenorhabditis elegans]